MQIGLLETDVLYDEFIDEYGSYGLMFEKYFTHINNKSKPLTFRYYHVQQGEFPESLTECDAYIITGSKAGAYEDHAWIPPLSAWIVKAHQAQVSLLGVCFGHQIITQALGGKVEQSHKGWGVGVRSLTTSAHTQFKLPSTLDLIYSHKDQVIEQPATAVNFLHDDFCPNAAYTLGKHIISFQGHPEFSAQYSRRLLDMRSASIGEPTCSIARSSLQQATDSEFVGRLILDFFVNNLK